MQVDTEGDVTKIPRNFCEKNWQTGIEKAPPTIETIRRTLIKVMGTFERIFETKKPFEMVSVTMVACNKDHKLLGTDVFKWEVPVV